VAGAIALVTLYCPDMKHCLIFLLVFNLSILYAQDNSFYLCNSHWDDRVYDAIELDNGDFILTGKSTNGSFEKLWLYRLDSSGMLVDSLIISGQNGLGRISRLIQVAEDTIVGIGDMPDEISGFCELFYIRFDSSLSYYEEKMYPVGNYVDCRFRSKTDGDSKLVVFGYLIDRVNPYDFDMAYFSLDETGNMLKQKIYDDENMRIVFDLLVKGGGENITLLLLSNKCLCINLMKIF
jgi:hypothetical protein